ncbi:hypothetical protein D3C80_1883470 [compost metagenome]
MIQHILAFLRARQQIGRHIAEDRLFVQVITDHIRNIDIHGFVISHSGPGSISDCNIAGPVSIHQTCDSEQ